MNIKSVADEFGVSPDRFLQLQKQNRLPGQLPSREFLETQDDDSDIDLGLELGDMKWPAWKRIKRAAKFSGETVKEFLTSTIMEAVRCMEGEMLLSPRTGKPIGNRWDPPQLDD